MYSYSSLLERQDRVSALFGIDLRVKRDDLLPKSGGGNKVRKLDYIVRDAAIDNCDALVTHGGIQSNHARVTALMAAEKGWRCKLILHGDPNACHPCTGNLLLMQLAGAEIEIVPSDQIMCRVDQAVAVLHAEGAKPYAIPGGGHCPAGVLAYADAVIEVAEQLAGESWIPDSIIVPSGTGATQAGIIVGVIRLGWPTRVIGVSVGRANPRGRQVVAQAAEEAMQSLGLSNCISTVDFRDQWLCGGYEKASQQVLNVIKSVAQTAGLILDPTYTGKAFAALLDLIEAGEIRRGEKVLFWHTGGLLNLISSSYFMV